MPKILEMERGVGGNRELVRVERHRDPGVIRHDTEELDAAAFAQESSDLRSEGVRGTSAKSR